MTRRGVLLVAAVLAIAALAGAARLAGGETERAPARTQGAARTPAPVALAPAGKSPRSPTPAVRLTEPTGRAQAPIDTDATTPLRAQRIGPLPRDPDAAVRAFAQRYTTWEGPTLVRTYQQLAGASTGAARRLMLTIAERVRADPQMTSKTSANQGHVEVVKALTNSRFLAVVRELAVLRGRPLASSERYRAYVATVRRTAAGAKIATWAPQT